MIKSLIFAVIIISLLARFGFLGDVVSELEGRGLLAGDIAKTAGAIEPHLALIGEWLERAGRQVAVLLLRCLEDITR